mmetsp:Transcript_1449/g.5300  ORF Transcript_1449/g.5300 Transcript_1449/m.5300 type:complete len:269 (+) Transcript_1449:470-1276(+)
MSDFNALRLLKSRLSCFAWRFASSCASASARRFNLLRLVLLYLSAVTARLRLLSSPPPAPPTPSSSSVSSAPNPLSKYNSFTKFAAATLFDTGTTTGFRYLACFSLNSFARATATTSSRASFGGLKLQPGCSGATARACVVGAVNFFASLLIPRALGAAVPHTSNAFASPLAFAALAPVLFATAPLGAKPFDALALAASPFDRVASFALDGGAKNIFPARTATGTGYDFSAGAFTHAASTFNARSRALSRLEPTSAAPPAAGAAELSM